MARILASAVGCERQNLLEIDAATHTGIDAMRAVNEGVAYKAFGESPVKVMIVDEAHALSKNAWQSLLKPVEEPPEHAYWIFCTTEPGKIPPTIVTRCATFNLPPVKADDIADLLARVAEAEGYGTPEDVLNLVARQSFGSPRQALTYLSQCYGCATVKEALPLLQKADEEGEAIDLVRALVKGGLNWAKAMKLLEPLREQSAESIRLVMLAYLSTVAMGSKTDAQAGRALEMMDAFSEYCNPSEGFAPLLLAIGRVIFRE
jgi:DNA polymerase-3 subunit gamma/tau